MKAAEPEGADSTETTVLHGSPLWRGSAASVVSREKAGHGGLAEYTPIGGSGHDRGRTPGRAAGSIGAMAQLTIATCQFVIKPVAAANQGSVERLMRSAKRRGARLAHFSEACVSGYLGAELDGIDQLDWQAVRDAIESIARLAADLDLWVVIGCNHRLTGDHRPHNSLYVIDPRGRIVDRYDKMFCTGADCGDQDLKHYSPGSAFATFDVDGVRCGLLICHDYRYPELFREYKRRGVEMMLVSFHNAGMTADRDKHYLMSVPATLQAAAASNFFAVSATNGARRYAWPSFLVNQEGWVVDRAPRHRAAALINTIDTEPDLYDASAHWRDRCLTGTYHSGTVVQDPRSDVRTDL